MDLKIKGKVALVTGSARGIGASIARQLAAEGAKVVIADIQGDLAEATASALDAEGFDAYSVACDITKASHVDRLLHQAIEKFGAIHILVNNAGFPRDNYLTKMTEEDWDSVIDVMLKGAFLVSRGVIPHMIEQGWGRIVNISSRAHFGNPTQSNYSAAKAGLIGFTKALAKEEGRYGITVNAVAPGFMETEMVRELPTYAAIKEKALLAQPIQRPGHPADVSDAVAFLVSERAGFISGEVLHISGGRFG